MKPTELKNIFFPECSDECGAVKIFGVCECESFCREKFDEKGAPLMKKEKTYIGVVKDEDFKWQVIALLPKGKGFILESKVIDAWWKKYLEERKGEA